MRGTFFTIQAWLTTHYRLRKKIATTTFVMWNAIKSDLFDFVATIQEDTTKTINKVLGEDDVVLFLANLLF